MERMIESRDIKHMACVERIKQLEEENKKLNIKVASLEGEIKGLNYTIEKLKEENQTLELWLDNKEKVNKSLREENKKLKKYYDRDKEELMESCYDLARENNKLKKDVDYFRQCYLDLKKLCEKEGFMLSDEEITKMFDLDKIK